MFDARFDPNQPRINPLAVDTPHIVEWIETKQPRAIENWNDLGADEYARSFTAAKTAGYDVVRDLYNGLLATLDAKGGESDYAARMIPVLRDKGWLPELDDEGLGRRVRLIYDTNLRTSQAVGKWRQFQRTKQYLPYIRYSAVMDRRTRPSHGLLHDIIRPVDDPFWQGAFPPCGFRCRCRASAITRSQLVRYGGLTDENRAMDALARARTDPAFWGRNVGVMADQVASEHIQATNERRLPGVAPVANPGAPGRALWSALFTQQVSQLLATLFGEQ